MLKTFCCSWMVEPERLCILDPRVQDAVPAFNPLARSAAVHPVTQGELVSEAILKAFGEQDEAGGVRFKEYGPALFSVLSAANLTFLEAIPFLTKPAFRASVLQSVDLPHQVAQWRHLDETFQKKSYEREIILQSLRTRVDRLVRHPYLARLLGQQTTNLNLREIICGDGGILLVNLGFNGLNLGQESLNSIGSLLLNEIDCLIRQRDSDTPLFVVIDEAQKFLVSPHIAEGLDQWRFKKAYAIILNQRLDQFYRKNPDVVSALMSNCANKIIFSVSRADAEILAPEIFSGKIYDEMQKPKDQIVTFSPWPFEVWRTITSVTTTESEGKFSGEAESFADSMNELIVETQNVSDTVNQEGDLISKTAGMGTGMHQGYGSSSSFVTSSGRHKVTGQSITQTPTPGTIHLPIPQVSSRTYPSHPEVMEKFIGKLSNQPRQACVVKIDDQPPVALPYPSVKLSNVHISELAEYHQSIYDGIKDGVAIDLEYQNRIANFISHHQSPNHEPPYRERKKKA